MKMQTRTWKEDSAKAATPPMQLPLSYMRLEDRDDDDTDSMSTPHDVSRRRTDSDDMSLMMSPTDKLLLLERTKSKGEARKRNRKQKKVLSTAPAVGRRGRVAAYCFANTLRLQEVAGFLRPWRPVLYGDVLHCTFNLQAEGWQGKRSLLEARLPADFDDRSPSADHLFVFEYGSVVFWGLTEAQEKSILEELKRFCSAPLAEDAIVGDDFEFVEPSQSSAEETAVDIPRSRIRNDDVFLQTYNPLEKIAVSFAMSQSVKLSAFEEDIERTIDITKKLPHELATTGKISLPKHEVSKKIGELFIKRNSINLESDILDTPDFFWEEDEFEPLYLKVSGYLEIQKRAEVLNKRLDIIKELLEMLNNELTSRDSSRVEYIIIFLVFMEVVVLVVWQILIKDILGFFSRGSEH